MSDILQQDADRTCLRAQTCYRIVSRGWACQV